MGIPNFFFKLGGSFSPPTAEDCTTFYVQPASTNATLTLALTGVAVDTLVSWGDGATDAGAVSMSHTYTSYSTVFKVKVTGTHTTVIPGNKSIVYGSGTFYSGLTSANDMFKGCSTMKEINGVKLPNGCTSAANMFSGCNNAVTFSGNIIVPETVTDLSYFMKDCQKLVIQNAQMVLPRNIARADYMFASCRAMKSLAGFSLANFNVAFHIFDTCYALESLGDNFKLCSAGAWNIQEVFWGCSKLVMDITNIWPETFTEKKINISNCFYNCSNITGTAPAALLWNNPGVTWDATGCFTGCTKLTNYNEIPSSWGGGRTSAS